MTDVKRVTNFILKSKISFFSIIGIMFSVTLIAITLFLCNVYTINGWSINGLETGDMPMYSAIVRIVFTPVGATLAILSLLLINRNKKDFIYFAIPSAILLTTNSLCSQLFYDAIKWLAVGTILLTQGVLWRKRTTDEYKSIKLPYIETMALAITLLVLGLLVGLAEVYLVPNDSPFHTKEEILDPLQFMFTVAGNVMMIFFIVQSRFIYLIGNVLTAIMFIKLMADGDLLVLVLFTQIVIYNVITICGYITLRHSHTIKCSGNRICQIN